jgi:hypothetical protein
MEPKDSTGDAAGAKPVEAKGEAKGTARAARKEQFTLALIGFGFLGRATAAEMCMLGVRTNAYDRDPATVRLRWLGIPACPRIGLVAILPRIGDTRPA